MLKIIQDTYLKDVWLFQNRITSKQTSKKVSYVQARPGMFSPEYSVLPELSAFCPKNVKISRTGGTANNVVLDCDDDNIKKDI